MTSHLNCNIHGFSSIYNRVLDHSKHIVQCNYPDGTCYMWGIDRAPPSLPNFG